MQTIEDRPTIQPVYKPPRTGLVALLTLVIFAIVALVGWLVVREEEPLTSTEVVQEYAAAMRADAMESVLGFDSRTEDGGFIEWQIALELEPEFIDCTETPGANATLVACTVTSGDEYFYSVIAGRQLVSRMTATVDQDGAFTGQSWPPPVGLTDMDNEFREWVQASHPELESEMWGLPGYLGIKMTRESGEQRMELLDEYLAAR